MKKYQVSFKIGSVPFVSPHIEALEALGVASNLNTAGYLCEITEGIFGRKLTIEQLAEQYKHDVRSTPLP
jgi:hypothetical protein